MRTTVTLDDDLLADAKEMTGIQETRKLIDEALRGLIAREAARRLRLLQGSVPDAKAAPRRRFPPDDETE